MDTGDLDSAEKELSSLLHKCEAVLQGSTLSQSKTTLMRNRVGALRTALELIHRTKLEQDE
ncbi:hypothetical protein [Brevibacterium atlanticum]|uniref:hypothetical protein n=1 Tax=Brevibacterium atlanticum TaxID=2697563 RepID=UPI0014216CDA|nr:hypothetical protein [Brevibacterium atlanticum]